MSDLSHAELNHPVLLRLFFTLWKGTAFIGGARLLSPVGFFRQATFPDGGRLKTKKLVIEQALVTKKKQYLTNIIDQQCHLVFLIISLSLLSNHGSTEL